MPRVIVVGGGISGLATAFRLLERPGVDVLLVEADRRIGGTVGTLQQDGFLIDTAPNGYLDSRAEIVALVNDLGLADRQVGASDAAKKRFTVHRGQLLALPANPLGFFASPLLSPASRLRVMVEPLVYKGPPDSDESVFEFACRRVGRGFAERLIDPMVRGVFAGDPHKLSLRSTFPRMFGLEADYGTLTKALLTLMWQRRRKHQAGPNPSGFGGRLTSFPQGIQEVTDRLAERLGDRIATGQRLTALERTEGGWRLRFDGDGPAEREAEAVVLAIPSYAAAQLVAPLDPALHTLLGEIPYASVTVVSLGYRREDVDHPLDGFGFVTAGVDEPFLLGCLFTSSIFPNQAPAGSVLLRCMVGGTRDPESAALPDGELVTRTHAELDRLLGLRARPAVEKIVRWPQGIPQYHLGHGERLERIDDRVARHPGLFLTGNAYRGVALNDCAREGADVARRVAQYLGSARSAERPAAAATPGR